METIVIRIEVEPESAEAAKIAVGLVLDSVHARLADSPPVHTKRALEDQRERLDSVVRAIDLALANPVEVTIPVPDAEDAS